MNGDIFFGLLATPAIAVVWVGAIVFIKVMWKELRK
jgi:hypothetical protein